MSAKDHLKSKLLSKYKILLYQVKQVKVLNKTQYVTTHH